MKTDSKTGMVEAELVDIEARVSAATRGPWQSFVEGRDHSSGDDMIRLGGVDDDLPDMYVSHGRKPAPAGDLDFIASARQDVPRLVAEVRRLRALLKSSNE